jgi:hypothetical protein
VALEYLDRLQLKATIMGFRGSRVRIPPSRYSKRLISIKSDRTPGEMPGIAL